MVFRCLDTEIDFLVKGTCDFLSHILISTSSGTSRLYYSYLRSSFGVSKPFGYSLSLDFGSGFFKSLKLFSKRVVGSSSPGAEA